jgi:hypothetical protein
MHMKYYWWWAWRLGTGTNFILTWMIAQGDFMTYSQHKNFKSYIGRPPQPLQQYRLPAVVTNYKNYHFLFSLTIFSQLQWLRTVKSKGECGLRRRSWGKPVRIEGLFDKKTNYEPVECDLLTRQGHQTKSSLHQSTILPRRIAYIFMNFYLSTRHHIYSLVSYNPETIHSTLWTVTSAPNPQVTKDRVDKYLRLPFLPLINAIQPGQGQIPLPQ